MKLKIIASLIFIGINWSICFAQRLAPFGSESSTRIYGDQVVRNPYDATISYFECIDSANLFIVQEREKEFYTLYFFIDDTLKEIGVRALSPVPELTSPGRGQFATEDFYTSKNKKKGFNSFVSLNRAVEIKNRAELSHAKKELSWKLIGENNDSKEMDKPENSLFRVVHGKNDTYLLPGLYRIRISKSENNNEKLAGSFLLQMGVIPATQLSPLVSDWRKL